MKKIFIFMLFSGLFSILAAQERKLLKILNRELKKEVKNQLKSSNFNGDTIEIIKPFTLDAGKKLSFQVKRNSPYLSGSQLITQEVNLHDIKNIGKDINVLFITDDGKVTSIYETRGQNPEKEILKGGLFFLFLSNEKHNESLGIALQSAFKNAGYNVARDYWYD